MDCATTVIASSCTFGPFAVLDQLNPGQTADDQQRPAKKETQHRQNAGLPHRRDEEGFAFEREDRRNPTTSFSGVVGSCGRYIVTLFG